MKCGFVATLKWSHDTRLDAPRASLPVQWTSFRTSYLENGSHEGVPYYLDESRIPILWFLDENKVVGNQNKFKDQRTKEMKSSKGHEQNSGESGALNSAVSLSVSTAQKHEIPLTR